MKTRKILTALLVVCLLFTLAACSSSSLTGKYVIVDITDDPEGVTFSDLNAMYKAVDENIEDYMFMEFSEGNRFKLILFGEEEASGVYTQNGNTLTFNGDGEMTTATISGKKIIWIYENGAKLIFEKE